MAELDISTKNCIVEQEGSVLIVTLNRPEAKNAFSPEMLLGMYKAWRLLEEDDSLMCAILTANGDTFCAGMDLKAGADGEHRSTEEFMELMGTVPNIHWQDLPVYVRHSPHQLHKFLCGAVLTVCPCLELHAGTKSIAIVVKDLPPLSVVLPPPAPTLVPSPPTTLA